jgi:hypothetical protein
MNEDQMIENWGAQKRARNFNRLCSSVLTEYEFIGQRGHPSSYSYVKFIAEPADRLSLAFEVEWPTDFDETYTNKIKQVIAEAVVGALWLVPDPYRGCHLRLVEFKWDTIGGSEKAVHTATLLAMHILIGDGDWEEVTGR